MTPEELEKLTNFIRSQANTWLGDEACEAIERLIRYTETLQKKVNGK